jgi:hypothetical protein
MLRLETGQYMDVILDSADRFGDDAERSKDAPDVGVQIGSPPGSDRGNTVLRAEDRVAV